MIEVCMVLPHDYQPSLETEATVNTLLIFGGCDTQGPVRSACINDGRNTAIARAKHDEILFVDGDVSSSDPIGDLKLLVESGYDVVAGAYSRRGGGDYAAAYLDGDTERYFEKWRKGMHDARWVGMGFTYINLAAIREKLPKNEPLFRHEWIVTPDSVKHQTSEDVGFCIHARNHGAKIGVCCDTHLVHEGVDRPITYRRSGGMEGKGNAAVAMPQQQISVDQWAASAYKACAQVQATIAFVDEQLRGLATEVKRLQSENAGLKKELGAAKSPPTEAAKDESAVK